MEIKNTWGKAGLALQSSSLIHVDTVKSHSSFTKMNHFNTHQKIHERNLAAIWPKAFTIGKSTLACKSIIGSIIWKNIWISLFQVKRLNTFPCCFWGFAIVFHAWMSRGSLKHQEPGTQKDWALPRTAPCPWDGWSLPPLPPARTVCCHALSPAPHIHPSLELSHKRFSF